MSDTTVRELNAVHDLLEMQKSLGGPGWLKKIRKAAAERFAEMEWPSTNEEEWRRTSLRAFEFDSYRPAVGTAATEAQASDVPAGAAGQPDLDGVAGRLSMRNGRLVTAALGEAATEAGVRLATLSDLDSGRSAAHGSASAVLKAARELLEESLTEADNRLILWQIALLDDAAVLYVPRSVRIDAPFVLDFDVDGDEVVVSQQIVVVAEEDSSSHVVKRVTSAAAGETLVLDGEQLSVGANSGLRFTTVQSLNDESLVFHHGSGSIHRDGRLHRTEAQLGSDFAKTRFATRLVGKGADAALNGIYFTTDENHMDIRTVQAHEAARTSSRAYYRCAVQGESHGIYQGLISVAAEAPGTDAYLTSKNLILSEESRADSIPSLNIATDDVRCSHGSTTGKIDEGQIFYLRTRGYTEEEARLTLIEGYFEDLIEQTPEMIQGELRDLVAARIVDQDE